MTAQQLKNSILQMAVQGKLVPQDPNDEPASVLIERIRAEKEKLIKEKKIKKEKNPSVIFRGADNIPYEKIGDEVVPLDVPFDIPDSWEWVRGSNLGEIGRGSGIKRTETVETGLPCVRYGELYTTYNISFTEAISFIPEDIDSKCRHFSCGDVLMTLTGENKPDIAKAVAYLGETPIAAGGDLAYWTHHGLNPLYLVYALNSPYAISRKVDLATGDIIVHISGDKIGSILIPVPPLAEQDRIVCKIQELEVLTAEYGIKENSLSQLQNYFPEQLKKSILQWAVQGKLVPQDENDEPAEVLLERIRAEKDALIKAGKIKRDKHESVIFRRDNSHYEKRGSEEVCIDDEIPFEIPSSWQWVRFSTIACLENGDRSSKYPTDKDYVSDGIPFFGAKDMGNIFMEFSNVRYITKEKFDELGNGKLVDGDFICLLRGTVGKTRIFKASPKYSTGFICAQMVIIRCHNPLIREYIYNVISSPYYAGIIESKTTGTAVRQLPAKEIADILIPIPPIEEQYRINGKLSTLLSEIRTL